MASQSCEKIKVYARVRPSKELGQLQNVIHIDSPNQLTIQIDDQDKKNFQFDGIFGEDSTQENVFNEAASRIVHGTLNGYNGTIFAYGQTGSGKTHTMIGPSGRFDLSSGIIPRGLMLLFDELADKTDKMPGKFSFKISISFVEIYNEYIYDLFAMNEDKLKIGQDREGNAVVKGASEQFVQGINDAMEEVMRGWSNRSVAETAMNRASSRSHALLLIKIRTEEVHGEICTARSAFLNLVDLAGSERVSQSKVEGARLKETANINKSLLQLKIVIRELAENKKEGFVPFRSSVLTHILKDSLGGNARTAVMINVHPDKKYHGETYSTLQFSAEVRRIENKVVVNEDLKGDSVVAYKAEIRRLQEALDALQGKANEEIAELRRQLESWKEAANRFERQLAVAKRNALNMAITTRDEGHAAALAQQEELWERSMAQVEDSARKLPIAGSSAVKLREMSEKLSMAEYEKEELVVQLDAERKAKAEIMQELMSYKNAVTSPRAARRPVLRESEEEEGESSSGLSSMLGDPLEGGLMMTPSAAEKRKERRRTRYTPSRHNASRQSTHFRPVLELEGEEQTPLAADNHEEERILELEMRVSQQTTIIDEKIADSQRLARQLADAEERVEAAEERFTESSKAVDEEKERVREASAQIERLEKRIGEEREKISELMKREARLQEELVEKQNETESLQSEIALTQSNHEEEIRSIEEMMRGNLSDKEKTEVDLRRELEQLKKESEEKKGQLEQSLEEKMETERVLKEYVKDLQKEKEAKDEKINELVDAMVKDQLDSQRAAAQWEEEKERRDAAHREQLAALELQLQQQRAQIEEIRRTMENEQRASLSSLEDELMKKVAEATQAKSVLMREHEEKSRQFADLTSEMGRMRLKMDQQSTEDKREITKWKDVANQFSEKMNEMRVELTTKEGRMQEAEASVIRMTNMQQLQQQENDELTAKLGDLGTHANNKQKIHTMHRYVEEKRLLTMRAAQLESLLKKHGIAVPHETDDENVPPTEGRLRRARVTSTDDATAAASAASSMTSTRSTRSTAAAARK